ncbi:hypothetical protein [Xanthomonas arboricola]|uniref:hypothetical protein n=1 Tax=Xanthomonas arboricola TaxID=56448 RepID=UPI0015E280B3|nr:hypothetical protein [Xanthomonas arboricola]
MKIIFSMRNVADDALIDKLHQRIAENIKTSQRAGRWQVIRNKLPAWKSLTSLKIHRAQIGLSLKRISPGQPGSRLQPA